MGLGRAHAGPFEWVKGEAVPARPGPPPPRAGASRRSGYIPEGSIHWW
jgi:hypothetical protein